VAPWPLLRTAPGYHKEAEYSEYSDRGWVGRWWATAAAAAAGLDDD